VLLLELVFLLEVMILLRIVVLLNNTEELARHLQVRSLADVCASISSFMKELDTNEFHANDKTQVIKILVQTQKPARSAQLQASLCREHVREYYSSSYYAHTYPWRQGVHHERAQQFRCSSRRLHALLQLPHRQQENVDLVSSWHVKQSYQSWYIT
jgi:hypothetical protein